ncbi:FtsB family cell division protein [Pararhizobium haloflavum]|uniref:FtsB family cell division protein n=1 Tax=Pararhizobium haloflavum TaxID=2037914 RepID=UPI000C18C482|nr:septum formation initiator family protein [Pararhizobium haloflavum]
MWTRQKKKSPIGRLVVPAIAIAFFTYFGFHAVHGAFGLNSKMHLEHRSMQLEAKLADLVEQRKQMERRVALLDSATLERDMLDQQARALLNVSRDNEITIYR